MILESDTPAVTQFSVGDLKAGDKFRVLFPVFNRAEGLRVSVRKKDGSLEELKLNQDYAVLIPPNSGQAGYTAEVEYIGEERSDVYVFIVERVIRLSQETNLGSYGAEGRNQEFSLDKLTCILQDTRTGLHISSSEVNNPLTGTPKLELPYNRENSILAFDENKNVRAIPEYTGEEGVKISEQNVVSVDMDTMPVATEEHSGVMSKEDKIKLNAAMKFPDGEAGCTLPNAAGRKDRLITFDSNGNIDLHSTHDYDKWRNVRISTAESTVGLNLELPNPTVRANKVIGFGADGKSVEMRGVSGTDIIAGEGLQKNGDEISLRKATALTHGGVKVGSGLSIDGNGILSATGGGDEFINEPVITGDMVSESIAFVERGFTDGGVNCVASFVINGKKTFFVNKQEWETGRFVNYIYKSHDCAIWDKIQTPLNTSVYAFILSGTNILFFGTYGRIFFSSDDGYTFNMVYQFFNSGTFFGWCEYHGTVMATCGQDIAISVDEGLTWQSIKPNIPDANSFQYMTPVFFKGRFFVIAEHSYPISEIISMNVITHEDVVEYVFDSAVHPTSLTEQDGIIYAIVADNDGYPQSFIYSSTTGADFKRIQTYNNTYERLLGRPNKWLLVDNSKNAWFCKNLSDNPLQVHFNCFGGASDFHYSKDTDLFVTHDMSLLVSTKAYQIGG